MTYLNGDVGDIEANIDRSSAKSQPTGAEYNQIVSVQYIQGSIIDEVPPFSCPIDATCTGKINTKVKIVYELSKSYFQYAISSFANGHHALGVSSYSFGYFSPNWRTGLKYTLNNQEKFYGTSVVFRLIPTSGECQTVNTQSVRCTQISDFTDRISQNAMEELKQAQNIQIATNDNGVIGDPFVRLHLVLFGSTTNASDDTGQIFDEKPLDPTVTLNFLNPPQPSCNGTSAKLRSDNHGQAPYVAPDSPQNMCEGNQQNVLCLYSTGATAGVGTRADGKQWLCDTAIVDNRTQGVWFQCNSTRINRVIGDYKCKSSGWETNTVQDPTGGGNTSSN